MRAIRLHEFGPPENLRYEEVPDPTPGPDEVRVTVAAAGVHVIDTTIRSGQRSAARRGSRPDLPTTPGRDVAGVVDALGAGVDPTWLGRRVVAYLGPASGGYAERAVGPGHGLHALPDGVGFDGRRRDDRHRAAPRWRSSNSRPSPPTTSSWSRPRPAASAASRCGPPGGPVPP
jgi:NADPH2:quinone reductase